MKEFKVIQKDKYVVSHRLSINYKIYKLISKEELQKLVEMWLNKIQVDGKIEISEFKNVTITTIEYKSDEYMCGENHTIDLYKIKPQFDIREV